MEPHVKAYLRNKTFRDLEDEHGVCARLSSTGDKLSLNYDQILAKNGDQVSEQCRGMVIRPIECERILAAGDGWKDVRVGEVEVLAWPMCRFYNFGDHTVANVDWSDPGLRVYEKVDGTCIIVYWDPLHDWCAATRSVSEADLPINSNSLEIGAMTFSQLFLKALIATREETSGQPVDWEVSGPDRVIHLNKEVTYVFELVSRHNQLVVDYPEPRVYLIAARHLPTGKEQPIESLRIQHVRRPRTWPLRDAVSVGAFVNSVSPSELEGAVVCDSSFRRMKIKSVAYVLAHKSKDSVTASPRNALEAIILEKIDDIVPLVPKDVGEKMLRMQEAYAAYCRRVDADVARFKAEAAGSRKEYAMRVMASGDWTAPYFPLWEGKATGAHGWIRNMCENGKLSAGSLDSILGRMVQ